MGTAWPHTESWQRSQSCNSSWHTASVTLWHLSNYTCPITPLKSCWHPTTKHSEYQILSSRSLLISRVETFLIKTICSMKPRLVASISHNFLGFVHTSPNQTRSEDNRRWQCFAINSWILHSCCSIPSGPCTYWVLFLYVIPSHHRDRWEIALAVDAAAKRGKFASLK